MVNNPIDLWWISFVFPSRAIFVLFICFHRIFILFYVFHLPSHPLNDSAYAIGHGGVTEGGTRGWRNVRERQHLPGEGWRKRIAQDGGKYRKKKKRKEEPRQQSE